MHEWYRRAGPRRGAAPERGPRRRADLGPDDAEVPGPELDGDAALGPSGETLQTASALLAEPSLPPFLLQVDDATCVPVTLRGEDASRALEWTQRLREQRDRERAVAPVIDFGSCSGRAPAMDRDG